MCSMKCACAMDILLWYVSNHKSEFLDAEGYKRTQQWKPKWTSIVQYHYYRHYSAFCTWTQSETRWDTCTCIHDPKTMSTCHTYHWTCVYEKQDMKTNLLTLISWSHTHTSLSSLNCQFFLNCLWNMQSLNSHFSKGTVMRDYCDSPAFLDQPLFKDDSTALQIQLFYDDVEMANPLGANTKVHKLGMLPKRAVFSFKMYKSATIYRTGYLHFDNTMCRTLLLQPWQLASKVSGKPQQHPIACSCPGPWHSKVWDRCHPETYRWRCEDTWEGQHSRKYM